MNLMSIAISVFGSIHAFAGIDHNCERLADSKKPLVILPAGEGSYPSLDNLRRLYLEAKSQNRGTLKPLAIIDTGVDSSIADATGLNIVAMYDLTQNDKPVAKGKYVDDSSHGSGLATLVGATGSELKYTGVLPRHPLLIIRIGGDKEFFSEGSPIPFERFKRALELASAHGAQVVNMSWTASPKNWDASKTRDLIWSYADRLLIINAAGNERRKLELQNPTNPLPAGLYAPNLIKVGAANGRGDIYSTSNTGPAVDAYALGFGVPEYRKTEDSTVQTRWEVTEENGTSHSAPLIAALAVTISLHEPGLNAKALKMRVLEQRDSSGYINLKTLALSR